MAQIPNQLAFVRQIAVFGLHGAVDVTQSFEPGLNILHGKNGDGKTTLLHVIANLLEGDLEQFRYLKGRIRDLSGICVSEPDLGQKP